MNSASVRVGGLCRSGCQCRLRLVSCGLSSCSGSPSMSRCMHHLVRGARGGANARGVRAIPYSSRQTGNQLDENAELSGS